MKSAHSAFVKAIGEPERFDQGTMSRTFAIVGESNGSMPNLNDRLVELGEGEGRKISSLYGDRPRITISRTKRILSEEMQDVGEQELLMLLLMMTAELDQ